MRVRQWHVRQVCDGFDDIDMTMLINFDDTETIQTTMARGRPLTDKYEQPSYHPIIVVSRSGQF